MDKGEEARGERREGKYQIRPYNGQSWPPSHPWYRQIGQNTCTLSEPRSLSCPAQAGTSQPSVGDHTPPDDPQAHSVLTVLSICSEAPSPGPGHPGPAQAIRKQKLALKEEKTFRLPLLILDKRVRRQASSAVLLSTHGHTIARSRKEKTAPSARPRLKKKVMMAPAVSASAGFTFLKEGRQDYLRTDCPAPALARVPSIWGGETTCPPFLIPISFCLFGDCVLGGGVSSMLP